MCRQGERTWKVSGNSDSSPFFDFPAGDTTSLRGLYGQVQATILHDTGPKEVQTLMRAAPVTACPTLIWMWYIRQVAGS